MSPWERIVAKYAEKGDPSLGRALDFNLAHGFVFSTPAFFIMGHELDGAWFIEGMAGDCSKAWSILPYELPSVGFQRFDNDLRFYPIETLRRLSIPTDEMAKPA